MRTIAFFSQKGGVGKTTSCLNVAAALVSLGRHVLVIDLDGNACASHYVDAIVDFDDSVGAALLGVRPLPTVCRAVIPRLWLAPGSTRLLSLDRMADIAAPGRINQVGRLSEKALASELTQLDSQAFDYGLLDCPGGQPFMQKQSLLAADEVIVPTGLSVIDLYATAPTLALIEKTQKLRGGGRPSLLGFLPNEAGKGGVPAKLQAKLDAYDLPCFTPVRASALLKTINGAAQVARRFITLARPENPAARSYVQIAREIDVGLEQARQPSTPPASEMPAVEALTETPGLPGLEEASMSPAVGAVPSVGE